MRAGHHDFATQEQADMLLALLSVTKGPSARRTLEVE